jgi:hypothetical protein
MSNFDLKKYLAEGRLLKEVGMEASFLPVDPIPGSTQVYSDFFDSVKDKLMDSGEKLLKKIPKDQLIVMKSAAEKVLGPEFGKEDITMDNAKKVGKILMSRLNETTEGNFADAIANMLVGLGMTALVASPFFDATGAVAIGGLIAMVVAFIIGKAFGDPTHARSHSDY